MKKVLILLLLLLSFALPFASASSGTMKLLAVSNPNSDNPTGSTADILLEIEHGSGRIFIDSFPLSKLDTQISTRFAKEVACNFLERDCTRYDFFYTIRSNSAIVGGPSAGAAIAALTVAVLDGEDVDETVSVTGTINSGGIVGPVGGILEKIEAAPEAGIRTVVIPRFSGINDTNLTDVSTKSGVKVIEASQLKEVVEALTGKSYPEQKELKLDPVYIDTMKSISESLCARSKEMNTTLGIKNSTGSSLLEKGNIALGEDAYYSAASYCFGAGFNLRYDLYLSAPPDEEEIASIISDTQEEIDELYDVINGKSLETLTDLEAFMVTTDRLIEAEGYLEDARVFLRNSSDILLNDTLYSLAYGIERLNSAKTWSVFFGMPGKEFDITDESMKESCLKKISEVEERIQYIELYLPEGSEDAKKAVADSYEDYESGRPELCLYKSSIAKARIDMILNNMAISQDQVQEVISDRLSIARSQIARQNSRDVFPILGYSYYEYAGSLSESDPYSSLLYIEYSLELSSLDIYFEKKSKDLVNIDEDYIILYLLGIVTGASITFLFFVLKKQRSRHPKIRIKKKQDQR